MARSVKTMDGLNNPTEGTKNTTLVAQLEELWSSKPGRASSSLAEGAKFSPVV